MKEKEISLVDSNILVYAYEKEETNKKRIAQSLLTQCFMGKNVLAVSNQNLAEFAAAFLTKGRGDIEKIKLAVRDIRDCENFLKIKYNENNILSALHIFQNEKVPFWDSLLIATMMENGIYIINTENDKDFKIAGIKVINPFK